MNLLKATEITAIFENEKEMVRVEATRYSAGHFFIKATDSKVEFRWNLKNEKGKDKPFRRARFNTTLLHHYAKRFLTARNKRI